MPLYRFTFTDASTIDVHASDPGEARLHLAILQRGGQPSWPPVLGKVVVGEPAVVDKFKYRDALRRAELGG